jgi:hypothetical protein
MTRKVFGGGRLEDMTIFCRRKYCDRLCMAADMVRPSVTKSTHHMRARKHRKSACERCGGTARLNAHHKDRDYTNNAPDNIETLCVWCHQGDHGPERGSVFASRKWIDKELLCSAWETYKRLLETVKSGGAETELVAECEAILHRAGQL